MINLVITLLWHDIYKFAGVSAQSLDKCHQFSLSQKCQQRCSLILLLMCPSKQTSKQTKFFTFLLNPVITLLWHDIYKFAGVSPQSLDKCHQLSLSQKRQKNSFPTKMKCIPMQSTRFLVVKNNANQRRQLRNFRVLKQLC